MGLGYDTDDFPRTLPIIVPVEILLYARDFYEFLSVSNDGTFLPAVLQHTASSVRMRWDPI